MQIMFGDRELMVSLVGDAQLLVASEDDITDKNLDTVWRQLSIKRRPMAILNPPNEVPKDFAPRKGCFLLFEENARFKDGIPAAWYKWAKTNAVEVVPVRKATEDGTVKYLIEGMLGITFTKEAAAWYARVVGTSLLRMQVEHDKLRSLGLARVGLDQTIEIIGGTEEVRADKINRALGTPEACKLALEVDPKRAIPLIGYLTKALEMRKSTWWLALQVVKKGAMDKRFDFVTGVQVFTQYCYRTNQQKDQMGPMLELMQLCGVTPWYTP